jgi:hypothetical protein
MKHFPFPHMSEASTARRGWRASRGSTWTKAFLTLACIGMAPLTAWDAPTFSLEGGDGVLGTPASDTLTTIGAGGEDLLDPALGFPAIPPPPLAPPSKVISGAGLGIPPGPGVDIDALSSGTDPISLAPGLIDNLVFSVDWFSSGGGLVGSCVPTAPGPVAEVGTECGPGVPVFPGGPPNVAAGDLFVAPGVLGTAGPTGPPGFNLLRVDDDAIPSPIPPPNPFPPTPGLGLVDLFTTTGPSTFGDNLDALELDDWGILLPGPIYFSLDCLGTGCGSLVVGASGADVLVSSGGVVAPYAFAPALGLDTIGGPLSDDIDALALRDDGDMLYNAVSSIFPCDDSILFSVSKGSAITTAPVVDPISGLPITEGDVLTDGACVSVAPCPCPGVPVIAAHAEQLGLNTARSSAPVVPFADDLNALDVEPKELDFFPFSLGTVVVDVGGTLEVIELTGPTTVEVDLASLADTDLDTREQVTTEMTQLDIAGTASFGPVSVRIRPVTKSPFMKSTGEIEELVNNTAGTLDIPPFTATGGGDSFFDVFFEIRTTLPPPLDILHNETPKRMTALIRGKPPVIGDTYGGTTPVPLFTEGGVQVGVLTLAFHTPRPPVEHDIFLRSRATVLLVAPNGHWEAVELVGPTGIVVGLDELGDADVDTREEVPAEMRALELTGTSDLVGPITIRLRDPDEHPNMRSLGEIEELVDNTPGVLDVPPFTPTGEAESFFDVFFEVETTLPPPFDLLHTDEPKRMTSRIRSKPPAVGDTYGGTNPVVLKTEGEIDTGFKITVAFHTPEDSDPPVNHDIFHDSNAQIEVDLGGGTELVNATGPTGIFVKMGDLGDPDLDTLEQVPAEMIALELSGTSSFGPIEVHLRDPTKSPFMRSVGEIEELVNNTPGVLDLPPFTPTGCADSFFDVFFEIETTLPPPFDLLHNEDPKRMTAVICNKPPYFHVYVGDDPVELFTEAGTPTGFFLTKSRHHTNRGRHYHCYETKPQVGPNVAVTLTDQFGSAEGVFVKRPRALCTPASKNDEDLDAVFDEEHLMSYSIRHRTEKVRDVTVVNQFGVQTVDVLRPRRLMVPTAKGLLFPPPPLVDPEVDHFQCYRVRRSRRTPRFEKRFGVELTDQFGTITVDVKKPRYLCVPVSKNGEDPDAITAERHLMCFKTKRPPFIGFPVFVTNQFGPDVVDLIHLVEVCVPSIKLQVGP